MNAAYSVEQQAQFSENLNCRIFLKLTWLLVIGGFMNEVGEILKMNMLPQSVFQIKVRVSWWLVFFSLKKLACLVLDISYLVCRSQDIEAFCKPTKYGVQVTALVDGLLIMLLTV
jgi:hypothetical protein